MNWINIPITFFMSEEFRGCEPVDRATWLSLNAYCHSQENGGVIREAICWADRKWQQVAAVTLVEVLRECDLWHWDEDGNLHVHGYPADKEAEIRRLRSIGQSSSDAKAAAARQNGRAGGRPKNPTETQQETQHETQQETHEKPIERKGRERKGREEPPPLWAVEKDLARAMADLSSFEQKEAHYFWPPPDRRKTLKTKFRPAYEALRARIADLEALKLAAK